MEGHIPSVLVSAQRLRNLTPEQLIQSKPAGQLNYTQILEAGATHKLLILDTALDPYPSVDSVPVLYAPWDKEQQEDAKYMFWKKQDSRLDRLLQAISTQPIDAWIVVRAATALDSVELAHLLSQNGVRRVCMLAADSANDNLNDKKPYDTLL
jgi:hypothetical protein